MSTKRRSLDQRGPAGYLVLSLVALLTVAPFIYAFAQSFRTTGQIANDPVGVTLPPSTASYTTILSGDLFWMPLLNSILVALLTGAFVLIAATLATFAISRFRFRGRETIYNFFTLGLLFPASVAILPLYLLLRQLGLVDTLVGVALPQAAFALPITIVILRPFFQSIPREIEEAAALDGISPFGFFVRILLPMAIPSLTTVTILAVVASWNGYLLPLLVLPSRANSTLPLGLAQFQGSFLFDTGAILAYTVLAILPILLAYGFIERYIVQGLTAGATKG